MNFQVVLIRHCLILGSTHTEQMTAITVKPPKKGHIGDVCFVPSREVVLFSEVFTFTC